MPSSANADRYPYRPVFRKHPDAILSFDRNTLRILAANEAAARLYGWSRAELEGRSLLDFRPADQIPRLRRILARSLRSYRVTLVHRRKASMRRSAAAGCAVAAGTRRSPSCAT